jgi:hypothetical protein
MNRLLVALGIFAASALIVPDIADARYGGGRGGGGFRGGGFHGGGRMMVHRGGFGGYRGGAVAVRRGGFYRGGVAGVGRYRVAGGYRGYYGRGWRGYGGYGGYYRRYPYYGYGGAALATGLAVGAAAAPYYGYGYGYPYYGTAGYGGDCYWVRRRVATAYGGVVVRRVQVCG